MNKPTECKPVDSKNKLDEFTNIRIILLLKKLGITVPDAKDLADYLFSLLGDARRKVEELQKPPPLTQDEMRKVLDLLESAQIGIPIGNTADEKIESAIAILKEHLHG